MAAPEVLEEETLERISAEIVLKDRGVFLDAAPEVRGMRRFEQVTQSGPGPGVQPEEVIRDLRARDERDRNRVDSPLKPAPDAILLDSTEMTLDEAVQAAEAIVAAKLDQTNSHS